MEDPLHLIEDKKVIKILDELYINDIEWLNPLPNSIQTYDWTTEEYINITVDDILKYNQSDINQINNDAPISSYSSIESYHMSMDDRIKKTKELMYKLLDIMVNKIKKYNILTTKDIIVRNYPLFYNNVLLPWHANCRMPGLAWNFVYNLEDTSFFRYIDINTGEMITKHEPKGWSINYMIMNDCSNPFWHCVFAETHRISYGIGE